MSFLLDTNVVSEWAKPEPHPRVVAWLDAVDEDRTFLSVVTLAEIRHGIERLTEGVRRRRLEAWLQHELTLRFEGRVLTVGIPIADAWGRVMARCEAVGRPIGAMDACIAATAIVHRLTIVTPNGSDFAATVVDILDPWTD